MRKGLFIIMLCGLTAGLAGEVPVGWASDSPTTGPATPAPSLERRSLDAIFEEYQQINAEVRSLVRSPEELLDSRRRDEIADRAIPKLKQLLFLADELETAGDAGRQFAPDLRSGVDAVLVLFNDEEAIARLEARANDPDRAVASRATCALLYGQWVRADGDLLLQNSLLSHVESLAIKSPEDDHLAVLVLQMGESAPATPQVRERALAIATTKLKGEMAQQIKQQMESDLKLASLEGKPLTITGTTHTGEPFSSDAWKGKVVIVDFAVAAWPPSRQHSERLAELYTTYHGKGLEIVTISCDESVEDLAKFLSDTPKVVWPHLFDVGAPGWHPVAKELSVTDPSTAILINRDGIVISTDARDGLREHLAELFRD